MDNTNQLLRGTLTAFHSELLAGELLLAATKKPVKKPPKKPNQTEPTDAPFSTCVGASCNAPCRRPKKKAADYHPAAIANGWSLPPKTQANA